MTRSAQQLRLAGYCFAVSLRAFPRPISERYGEEMIDAFVRERALLGATEGRWPAFWYSLAACFNVGKEGLATRRRERRDKRAAGTAPGAGGGGMKHPLGRRWSPAAWLADLNKDVRFALRTVIRAPAFAVVAVLSLAVGISVNTALATIVGEVWLKPVPGVPEHDRIVEAVPLDGAHELWAWTYPDFDDVRRTETTLEMMAGRAVGGARLTLDDRNEGVSVAFVSADFFRMLGVVMPRGRDFLASEDVGPGQHPVVIVSHAMWQNRLGGDEDILGRTLSLDHSPYTVIGIAPEEFTGVRPLSGAAELWAPLMQHPGLIGADSRAADRETLWVQVFGRMRPGATIDETNASLRTAFAALGEEYPETNENRSALVRAFARFPAQNRTGDMLAVVALLALVAVVLLIICGNVAGMMLARSAVREQEFAVRMALGSGRLRLVRQLMVEAVVLAVAGGSLGIAIGFWLTGFATPERLGVEMPDVSFQPNGEVLLFSLGLTAAATLVIGLLPALRFSQPQLLPSLKDDAGAGGRRAGRIHRFAASAQTGIALLFVVTCSLFVRAIDLVEQKGFGFEPENLLVTRVGLAREDYASFEDAWSMAERIRDSVGAVPGVVTVSLADGIPLDLSGNFARVGRVDHDLEAGAGERVEFTQASEGFFEAIGTPILRGRGFEPGDDATTERVVVITEDLADILWPGEEALGKRLRYESASGDPFMTVIGIVPHVASSIATRDLPHIFVALRQGFVSYERYGLRAMLVMRGALEASALVAPIRSAMLETDPALLFPVVVTSESLVARSTGPQRATLNISAGLGLLALVLAAIGVYSVVAFAVANRTREIGLRMAIGASREQVLREVFKDGLRLALPGLVIGGLLAVGTAILIRSELLGISPLDPLALGASAVVMLAVVLAASFVPARRASSVDPMNALRYE